MLDVDMRPGTYPVFLPLDRAAVVFNTLLDLGTGASILKGRVQVPWFTVLRMTEAAAASHI